MNLSPQALADSEGARAERTFLLWHAWAQEHTLQEIERSLRAEGVTRTPLPLAGIRRRWVVVAALILIGFSAVYFTQVAHLLIAVYGS